MNKKIAGNFIMLILIYSITLGFYKLCFSEDCGVVINATTNNNIYQVTIKDSDNKKYTYNVSKVIYDSISNHNETFTMCFNSNKKSSWFIFCFVFYCVISVLYTCCLILGDDK